MFIGAGRLQLYPPATVGHEKKMFKRANETRRSVKQTVYILHFKTLLEHIAIVLLISAAICLSWNYFLGDLFGKSVHKMKYGTTILCVIAVTLVILVAKSVWQNGFDVRDILRTLNSPYPTRPYFSHYTEIYDPTASIQ